MIQCRKARLTTPKQPFFIFLSFFWPSQGKGLNPKALYLRPLPFSRLIFVLISFFLFLLLFVLMFGNYFASRKCDFSSRKKTLSEPLNNNDNKWCPKGPQTILGKTVFWASPALMVTTLYILLVQEEDFSLVWQDLLLVQEEDLLLTKEQDLLLAKDEHLLLAQGPLGSH